MAHVVQKELWGTVDLDTDRAHVFVRQDWRYEWTNAHDVLPWTSRERAAYHKAIDRLIWRYWSFQTFVEVRKAAAT